MDYYRLAGPLLRLFDAEQAHGLAIKALTSGLVPAGGGVSDPVLETEVFGLRFANPVGLAAGFDKNAEAADALLTRGFGFVEIGSVTPVAQAGNPKPRLFRLTEDGAVINRMGFNNDGADAVAARLRARSAGGVLGVNLGKNKTTEDAASDYEIGVETLGALGDYITVNVSSPNTPGLRALQGKAPLEELLGRVLRARDAHASGKPVLLKVAPDVTDEDKRDIAEVAVEQGIDGLIVSNTTIARPDSLVSKHKAEAGGLSGAPLFQPSTACLADFRRETGGKVPLVGVGGIASGDDAYAKIRNGASLVQLYSALVYGGLPLVGRINRDLAALVRKDGFSSIADAVGADVAV